MNAFVHINTCIRVVIATSFIIAKIWKKAKCSSPGEELNRMWYIHMVEYYSSMKRNKERMYPAIWMNMKMMLNEIASHKNTCCIIHSYKMSREDKFAKTENRLVAA